MGVLIQLTQSTTPPPVRAPLAGDAEILFFTGVRYYRLSDREGEILPGAGESGVTTDDDLAITRPDHHA